MTKQARQRATRHRFSHKPLGSGHCLFPASPCNIQETAFSLKFRSPINLPTQKCHLPHLVCHAGNYTNCTEGFDYPSYVTCSLIANGSLNATCSISIGQLSHRFLHKWRWAEEAVGNLSAYRNFSFVSFAQTRKFDQFPLGVKCHFPKACIACRISRAE